MTDPIAPIPKISSQAGILSDTSRLASKENLAKAGQRFEAIFAGMMLGSMRKAKLTDGDLFDSQALQQFRDMQDQQLAQKMAEVAPMGIGKAMTEFLARSQPELAAKADGDTP